MKATDFRIGNWVNGVDDYFGRGEPKPIQIDAINDDGDSFKLNLNILTDGETDCLKNISPIPLTDEWLDKLGFHFVVGNWRHQSAYQFIITNKNYFGLGIEYGDDVTIIIRSGNISVHQLQNLWYALTGVCI